MFLLPLIFALICFVAADRKHFIQDIELNVIKLGLKVDGHQIITKDGYILKLHHFYKQ